MIKFYNGYTGQELELWTEWIVVPEKGDKVHLESGDYKVQERRIAHGLVQIYVYNPNSFIK